MRGSSRGPRGAEAGYDWRSVVDALRPHLRRLWGRLLETERRRFLRHVCPYWEVHRHRVAPEVAQLLDALGGEGRLTIQRGRLRALRPNPVRLVPIIASRGDAET